MSYYRENMIELSALVVLVRRHKKVKISITGRFLFSFCPIRIISFQEMFSLDR